MEDVKDSITQADFDRIQNEILKLDLQQSIEGFSEEREAQIKELKEKINK